MVNQVIDESQKPLVVSGQYTNKEVEEYNRNSSIADQVVNRLSSVQPSVGTEKSDAEMYGQMKPQYGAESWLVGALPMLAGVMMGDIKTGADVAGKAMIQEAQAQRKEEQSLKEFFMKRKLKRDTASAKGVRHQLMVKTGPDGKPVYSAFDPYAVKEKKIGSLSGEEIKKAYAPVKKFTDEEGMVHIYDQATGRMKPISEGVQTPTGTLTPRQDKLVQVAKKDYNTVYKKNFEQLSELSQSVQAMHGGGQLGTKLGIMKLIKTVEQRISDKDRPFYVRANALWNKLKEEVEVQKGDQMPLRLQNEALKITKMFADDEHGQNTHMANMMADQLSGQGVPRDTAIDVLLPSRFRKTSMPEVKMKMSREQKDAVKWIKDPANKDNPHMGKVKAEYKRRYGEL